MEAQNPLASAVSEIPQLMNKDHVTNIINLQEKAIDRLESTNKSLISCNTLAQGRLASTAKLFKKTSKQMSEAKKDLDFIYKKIQDLKNRIKTERPDLFSQETTETVGETRA